MTINTNEKLALGKPARTTSRDEMNLAEFPLAVLSTRVNPSVKTLEFSDTVYSKAGKPINRNWIITGADKFGLPTASDDEVLLGLLKLTVDNGFDDRKVYFTRYELLRILKWSTEGRSYTRLQNALDRLSGVRVKASNAFWDNESKAHSTRNFGILDEYEINDGRDSDRKPSFFRWSEVLFTSFHAGFIKKLDLDFYLELRSAVSRRLYRYLDKKFWYKSKVTINLFTLAHEKIGISRNYKYPSSLRQQLDPAIDELVEEGFLSGCEYSGRGKNTEITLFSKKPLPRSVNGGHSLKVSGELSPQESKVIQFPGAAEKIGNDSELSRTEEQKLYADVLEELTCRGILSPQARRLLDGKSTKELERFKKIIDYYDALISTNSHLISKNPSGWLYSAIKRAESFVLPGEQAQVQLRLDPSQPQQNSGGEVGKRAAQYSKQKEQADEFEKQYVRFQQQRLQKIRADIEPRLLAEIEQKVQSKLRNIENLISAEKFALAVTHAVNDELARTFLLPSREEWKQAGCKEEF
jgi:hypothetical protein